MLYQNWIITATFKNVNTFVLYLLKYYDYNKAFLFINVT